MGKSNIKLSKRIIALLLTGYIMFAPVKANSAKSMYRPGTIIEINIDDEKSKYNQYVVAENDNLSKISIKICKYFGEEKSAKHWSALAFLNKYPKVIHKGDIIIFPKTFEELSYLTTRLEEIGWTTQYKIKNDVYGKRKKHKLSIDSVGELLADIYMGEENLCIDEDFINLYLEYTGMADKYVLTYDSEYDEEVLYVISHYIPSIEELQEYQVKHEKELVLK